VGGFLLALASQARTQILKRKFMSYLTVKKYNEDRVYNRDRLQGFLDSISKDGLLDPPLISNITVEIHNIGNYAQLAKPIVILRKRRLLKHLGKTPDSIDTRKLTTQLAFFVSLYEREGEGIL
jgi:hypothetical protein